jgi:chromate reductase, NAD(P)H dehydrogenase (quinone)
MTQGGGRPRQVPLICGSSRARSTNAAALRTIEADAPSHIVCSFYEGMGDLPYFNPDLGDQLPESVERLRSEIHSSDAILLLTPEYAGALPGSLKNLLDWTIGDAETGSIYEKPIGWLNVSPRGVRGALAELRTVLENAHARIVDDAVADVPITLDMVGPDGVIRDPVTRDQLAVVLRGVVGQPTGGR